jgi:hypothetical protein
VKAYKRCTHIFKRTNFDIIVNSLANTTSLVIIKDTGHGGMEQGRGKREGCQERRDTRCGDGEGYMMKAGRPAVQEEII